MRNIKCRKHRFFMTNSIKFAVEKNIFHKNKKLRYTNSNLHIFVFILASLCCFAAILFEFIIQKYFNCIFVCHKNMLLFDMIRTETFYGSKYVIHTIHTIQTYFDGERYLMRFFHINIICSKHLSLNSRILVKLNDAN